MRKVTLFIILTLICLYANAQQALWGGGQVVSPQINPDNSVTFRFVAPNAKQVQVNGDFLPNQVIRTERGDFEIPTNADLVLKDGVWEYTTEPLKPELYSYSFIVDGLTVRDPSNVYQIRDVASITNVFIISEKKGDCGDLYSVNDVPHGTVSRLWYPSPSLGYNRRLTVYTPAGYEDSKAKYPVLYLLHGAGGDEEAWISLGRTAQILDNLIAEGKAQAMIVVMTNGNAGLKAAPGEGPDGMFVPSMNNGAVGGNVLGAGAFEESFGDVIKYIDSHYRTIKKKSARAICGLSMGGYHSMHISHYYPDTFDYVGLFSAAIWPDEKADSPVYKDFKEQIKTQFAAKPQLYWIAIGRTDFLYQDNVKYRNFLDENGYPFEYFENEGGHIWRNWRIYLSKFATRVFQPKAPQLKKNNINKIVKAMTVEEKAGLLVGVNHNIVPGSAGYTLAIPRLGIPSIVLADGPAGLRIQPKRAGIEDTFYCTAFPIATLLSSTWNTELVTEVGNAMGKEVLEYGVDVILGPGMNLHRNPLNGRNFEYYSEDPLLTGKMAAAMVNGIQSNGVGTSVKHFAMNSQETQRMGNDAQADERTIREIYLKGFEIAVKEAQPWTIMTSYNKINGIFAAEHEWLINEVARGEWGFKGMVMTDWSGGTDAAKSVKAGNDVLMPGNNAQKERIIAAYNEGFITMDDIDACVKKVLELIVKTPTFRAYKHSDKPDLKAHAAITRNSAAEGMILLKNEGVLPLAADVKTVALFGNSSYEFIAGGTGSGDVNEAYSVSLREGLENAGYVLEEKALAAYTYHINAENERLKAEIEDRARTNPLIRMMLQRKIDELILSERLIKESIQAADAVFFTIGRNSGEFADRKKADDFLVSDDEMFVLKLVSKEAKAAGKKLTVVLNIGGVIETASWKDYADAILCAWQGGQEGGNTVADILKGVVNPSGKLPMTFPIKLEDHASTVNFPQIDVNSSIADLFGGGEGGAKRGDNVRNVNYTVYEEGVFVGYRHFDKAGLDVSYPFGYGLSYTTFDYSGLEIKTRGDKIEVSCTLTNTGSVAGKEVVELYVAAPKQTNFEKPVQELKGFAKTGLLAPGASEKVSISFNTKDLASFHNDTKTWVLDSSNDYIVKLAASSRDIRLESKLKIN